MKLTDEIRKDFDLVLDGQTSIRKLAKKYRKFDTTLFSWLSYYINEKKAIAYEVYTSPIDREKRDAETHAFLKGKSNEEVMRIVKAAINEEKKRKQSIA